MDRRENFYHTEKWTSETTPFEMLKCFLYSFLLFLGTFLNIIFLHVDCIMTTLIKADPYIRENLFLAPWSLGLLLKPFLSPFVDYFLTLFQHRPSYLQSGEHIKSVSTVAAPWGMVPCYVNTYIPLTDYTEPLRSSLLVRTPNDLWYIRGDTNHYCPGRA